MKTIKIICTVIFCLIASMAQSQKQKIWLSGKHSKAMITYYEDGRPVSINAVWSGGTSNNNTNVVVFGEFKTDSRGNYYFDIEKSAPNVELKKGTFISFGDNNCPMQGLSEGNLQNATGTKTSVASFEYLENNQYVTIQEAAWGTSICNGKTIPTYYILKVKNANSNSNVTQQVVQQTYNPNGDSSNASSNDTATVTGKIISRNDRNEMGGLDVPNWATFQGNDGTTIEISSAKPINSNGNITLEGYTKLKYHNGVMNATHVFYVTKVR